MTFPPDDAAKKPPKPPSLVRPPFPVAHTPRKDDPEARWHPLDEHAFAVAEYASHFARSFGGETAAVWAQYLGRLHDLGKIDPGFQDYLWTCYLADYEQASRPPAGSAPHKQAGALVAKAALKGIAPFQHLAQPLFGHHGRMLDWVESQQQADERQKRAKEDVNQLRARARALHPDLDPEPPGPEAVAAFLASPHGREKRAAEMFFRFLYSCLTDADSLDTEKHLNPENSVARNRAIAAAPTIIALRDRLRERQTALIQNAKPSAVNTVRRLVYEDCVRAATEMTSRIVRLTVPTGGGKTLSSLAYALEFAARHGLSRVIYAIPFTSIADQTARVFEQVFEGMPGAVLEHHSALEDGIGQGSNNDNRSRKLASQNWDAAPIVVTTTVQLFESLFGGRPGKCRKLHRLANAVIVLDEVQALPPELLNPLLDGLRLLSENYNTTVVLCTATQPALSASGVSSAAFAGLDPEPPEIVHQPERHFDTLRRVRYRLEIADRWEWSRVADEMVTPQTSALCIVNTRRQALDLLAALDTAAASSTSAQPPVVLHLSTLMCGRHRRRVLQTVRDGLVAEREQGGPPILLASTQLVEAGIDLNFARVLRALGPLPSLIQAAGRCNREGLLDGLGEMIVFLPTVKDDIVPEGSYKVARELTENELKRLKRKHQEADFDDPAWVTAWFGAFYAKWGKRVDLYDVQRLRSEFAYGTVADKMRLIQDDTVSVFVLTYERDEARQILLEADALGRMTDVLWRRAQPLCVNVFRRDVERLGLEECYPGLFVWPGVYDARVGLTAFVQDTTTPATGFAYDPSGLIG